MIAPGTTIYLAGPVSGRPQGNRLAFDGAALMLRQMGFPVVSPHELGIHPDAAWGEAMPVCLAAMMQARAVVALRGWRFSRGAQLEVQTAKALGWPVVDLALQSIDQSSAQEGI